MNKAFRRISASGLIFIGVFGLAACGQANPEPSVSPSVSISTSTSPSATPTPSTSPSSTPSESRTVVIETPLNGAQLSGRIVANGTACTFEAAVPYRLYLEAVQVRGGMVMATAGCPIGGTWSIDFGNLEPGNYRLKVMNISQKDGSTTEEDSVTFSVK